MVKQKQFARPQKAPKAKAVEPRTVDEFQDAADKEEETGGKWRAGDPAKSGRAFLRALEIYDKGLKKFSDNFDLAYNKARLELEVSQSPVIVEKVGLDLQSFLRQTLDSHRLALGLDADNIDVRFNTSQVLTSLAEVLSEDEEGDDEEAVKLLHESLEMLEGCLARQEMAIEQQKADFPEGDAEDEVEGDGGVPIESEGASKDETKDESNAKDESGAGDDEEQSAVIENPVTGNDLLDTVHASLSALTTLIPLVGESALGNLGDMAHAFTDNKAPNYVALLPADEQDAARLEVGLARAGFIAAFADAQYNARLIELQTYVERLQAFKDLPNKDADAHALTTEARARFELVLSALDQADSSSPADFPVSDCWKQLSITQELLTKATKLTTEDAKERKAEVYQSKGDAELIRFRLASMPSTALSENVRKSGPTLLANTFKFYKGAADHAKILGDEEVAEKAKGRMAVVHVMAKVASDESAGAGSSSSSSSSANAPALPGPAPKGVDLMEAMNECMDYGMLDLAGAEKVLAALGAPA
ncbi:hypothetical protein Q7P37_002725 [Cladosporium fusiforme]